MSTVAFLSRLWHRALRGGTQDDREHRYVRSFAIGTSFIWVIAIAYMLLWPKSYTASFTFVLPGTGVGSTMNLESLGQASTLSASPFSTPDVSPTENYRKMLLSHRVLKAASIAARLEETEFPTPRVDLTEQTKLIIVSLNAKTPELAQARAEILRGVFLHILDSLRDDEIAARDSAGMGMLGGYRATLEQARTKLITHQVRTGLVSLEQYNNLVSGVEHLRQTLQDVDVRLAQARGGVAELTTLLNTTPAAANLAMTLRADPFFQTGLDQLAKDDADIAGLGGTHGDANPKLHDLRAERDAIAARLVARSAEITGKQHANILKIPDLSIRDERAQLFERMVGQLADQEALAAMRSKLVAQIESEQARVVALAQDASRLDDLKRDVQVAEAVFSSALGRIGTSKADFFASYPMVQTLEAPLLPEHPSSPARLLSLLGAIGANIFLALALVMTWLRTNLLQTLLKSGSSTQPSSTAGFGISWAHST